jgi:intracellular multiplication protein IcmG
MMSDTEKNIPEEKDVHSFPEEEYHFNEEEPDLSSFDAAPPQAASSSAEPVSTEKKKGLPIPDFAKLFEKINLKPVLGVLQQNFALRIGLIVMVVLVLIGVIYRCSVDPLAEKINEKPASIPVSHTTIVKPHPVTVSTVPTLKIQSTIPNSSHPIAINSDQVSQLQKANEDLQSQMRDLTSQISNLRNNVDTTTASLKVVAEQLAQVAETVSNQAKVNAGLAELMKQSKNSYGPKKLAMPVQQIQCALQAIIPGRAWLVCSNGETLTVSQGTRISDYGIVRYIDATNGRVLTSSGQTITFSQEDS